MSDQPLTVEHWLQASIKMLAAAGIESARLDCLILLEDALGRDRAYLLAHPENQIPASKIATLNSSIVQRSEHRPLAYIRGKVPFFGRDFAVTSDVLVPRPETESIIELLKKQRLPADPKIVDVGTGSGCIGITAALEVTDSQVWLVDVDQKALLVAGKNAHDHKVDTRLIKGDLLSNKTTPSFDVILANLPYVPELLPINKAATFEPRIALFSGPDGLDDYKRFWQQIAGLANPPKVIITESLPAQHHTLAMLARAAGYYLAETLGFAQAFLPLSGS